MKKILIGVLLLVLGLAFYFATHQKSVIINLKPVGNNIGGYIQEKI